MPPFKDNFENTVKLTAPSGGVTSGTLVVIGAVVVLPLATVAAGAQFIAQVKGRINEVPAKTGTGQAWTAGDRLYWDNGNSRFTTTATGNNDVGAIAAADKALGTATGDIVIDNSAASIS